MKTTIKLSIILLIFASFSCSVNTEKESILPQNTAKTTGNLTKSARTSSIVNTCTIRAVERNDSKQPLFIVSFSSENLAERKGWDGTVKGGSRHTPFHNFIVNESGTILTELSPDELAPGNPLFRPGTPIGGIVVKGGKNPGGSMRVMKTDENGEIQLPEEWVEGEYLIQIESKTQKSEFVLTIGKEKIEEVDAPYMLVNNDGTIRNFYYEEDFQLHSEIANYLGVEKIVVAKGYYPVDYSNKKEGGKVFIKAIRKDQNLWKPSNFRFFEGTNPKGIDCIGFGIACFYNAETGIDKKDIRYYVVKPVIEKGILIGIEISEGKKGLNAVNVKLS